MSNLNPLPLMLTVTGFSNFFAVARQAKLMKQRVGMEDDEDEEEEEKHRAVWGRGKKIYYGADNVNYEVRNFHVTFQIFILST